MRSKLIVSLLILGIAASILGIMFVVGCGTVSSSSNGGGVVDYGDRVYVADYQNSKVLILNPYFLTLEGSIELPGYSSPKHVLAHPGGKRIFVSSNDVTSEVYVINTETNTVCAIIDSNCSTPQAMVFNATATKLFVACPGHSDVAIIDIDTSTDTYSFDQPINSTVSGPYVAGMAYNPSNNKLYIPNTANNRFLMVTAESGSSIDEIGIYMAYDVVYHPSTESVYLSAGGSSSTLNWVVSLEASTLTIVASWEPGSYPDEDSGFRNIAISPVTGSVYAGNHDWSIVDLVNPVTGASEPINVNDGASDYMHLLNGIAFSPDSANGYVIHDESGGADKVIIFNAATRARLGAITLPASGYYGIACVKKQ